MSIPREHRLRKHAEFEQVYRCGRRHFSQILTAFYLLRTGEIGVGRGPRVGITVGKALGKATTRNRIKRRVRAAVSESLKRLTRDVDVVINPKKTTLDVEFAQLLSEVGRAFDVIQQKAAIGKSVPSAVADGC
ncbi:MAG TPA: ribonuclease P protein component [Terriglobales bacterium]|nr:ribonuclease P protein component [Terriglobales bacterium]